MNVRVIEATKKMCPFIRGEVVNCKAFNCMMWVWLESEQTASEYDEKRIGSCGLIHQDVFPADLMDTP
jgi:hypothetical protein